MTQEQYWCERCKDFVVPIMGKFIHLHRGVVPEGGMN